MQPAGTQDDPHIPKGRLQGRKHLPVLWGLSGSKKYLRRSIPPLPQGCLFFV